MERYEFRDGTSAKFWEIERDGLRVRVRYGSVGASPRTQERTFASDDEAEEHRRRKVREKLKKGYLRASTGASAPPPPSSSPGERSPPERSPDERSPDERSLGERFADMVAELRDHPDVRVETAELLAPRPTAEVEAKLAASPFSAPTRQQLRSLYTAIGGLDLAWRLERADPSVRVDPAMIVGELNLRSLDELLSNAEYVDMMGDMGSPEKEARIARLYPLDLNEEGYATAIDRDADDGSTLAAVANDGCADTLPFGVGEWVERLLLCRGYAGFATISEGIHGGGEALVAVLEGVFGERDVGQRLGALAKPETSAPSLLQRVTRIFRARGIPATIVRGLTTDYSDVYAIFRDDFGDFPGLSAALSELYGARKEVLDLDLSYGELSLITRSSWDLGHHSAPPAFWSLIDEQLRGTSSAAEVQDRYAWMVARARANTRAHVLASHLRDLATALDAEADPELRELAWITVTEWKDPAQLRAAAEENLEGDARRILAALRSAERTMSAAQET